MMSCAPSRTPYCWYSICHEQFGWGTGSSGRVANQITALLSLIMDPEGRQIRAKAAEAIRNAV